MRLLEFTDREGWLHVLLLPDERTSLDPDGVVVRRSDGSHVVFALDDTLHLSEN